MEFDGSKGLVLGLSLNSLPSMVNLNTTGLTKPPSLSLDHFDKGVTGTKAGFEPSLTLGLSSNHDHNKIGPVGGVSGDHGILYRHESTVISGGGSSFSNTSGKREREVRSEESERVSNDNNYSSRGLSGASVDDVEDDDEYCVNARKKLRLTKPQSALLEEAFKHHSSLNPKQKQELARELKLRPRQVEVWFQNRRARTKLKQTEMNFEHLKQCCEKLTDENRRLQKELQELKALKSSPPFYMQLPAATLTMCPSCERIGDTKPHFFNSITNPYAAC